MSMYGKYPKIKDKNGNDVEQRPWPATDFTGDKGRTVQSDRDDADINKIVARFIKSGQLPPNLNGKPFYYDDVSQFGDLQESIIKVQEAEDLFMQFPADLRERFQNDPVQLIDFLADEGNRKEAEDLGLIVPKPVPTPIPPVEVPAK